MKRESLKGIFVDRWRIKAATNPFTKVCITLTPDTHKTERERTASHPTVLPKHWALNRSDKFDKL